MAATEQKRFVLRLRILSGIFVTLAILLIVRLYFIQIVHGAEYSHDAMGQYVESSPDTAPRGNIFFTDKTGTLVAAAVMQNGWRLAIVPKDITDPNALYATLNAETPIDHDRFFASVAKKLDPYEEIAFHVSDDAGISIRKKKLPGVILAQDQWRFYPGHDLAAQAIGFVGYQGDVKTGVYGLERSWNDTLVEHSSGRDLNAFAELFASAEAVLSTDPSTHQGSIITSIEPTVQQELEITLDGVMKIYTPKLAGGIIMNPHTGEIIALGQRPSFDANAYGQVADHTVFSNKLVEGRYEMGSIMKPLTMAAGIDSGAIKPTTTYNDMGCVERSGKKICNYDGKARHVVPMQEILSQSLNLGVTFIEETIGHALFSKYFHNYGLGLRTGIDLPNEAIGNLGAIERGSDSDVDYATASFGQGIAVSPVEMIRALSALANSGVLPSPHVVTGIRYASGATRSITVPEGPAVLSATSTEIVSDMLVTVVDKALLKGVLKQDHYSIAAKTGTAQIAIPGGGGYYDDRYLHSFFGYFPAHDPKFIIFLYAVEPHGAEFASASLAHPFMDIAQYLINYYQIAPDR